MDPPLVQYTKSGDLNIAYSVVGEGPFDVVFVAGWIMSSLEYAWEGPPADVFRRLASFCRLILFDKRGTGLSDRVAGVADLETRMDDVRAVMDAVGSRRAAIIGASEGGPMSLLFAATYPERAAAVVIWASLVSWTRSADVPWRPTREEYLDAVMREDRGFGSDGYADDSLRELAPDLDDDVVRRWWRRFLRLSSSPGALAMLRRMNAEIDVRHVLPTIRVPTLILHRRDDIDVDVRHGRYMAEHIPGAQYVELPGRNHVYFAEWEPIVDEIERFLTGLWKREAWNLVEADRVLATVLFTDIVGSTAKAAELGDRGWRDLLLQHHALIRQQLVRFRGREIDTSGDGFFATFDGPARAIHCAMAIEHAVRELGIEIRAGLHTGECELADGKVAGIAVHIGMRVAAEAAPGEVLVSTTVKDLVAGSGIRFRDRALRELKGVPGKWHLYAVQPE